jgi:hypothetical protein
MLVLSEQRHMSIADLQRPCKEVPAFSMLGVSYNMRVSLGICRIGERAVHDSPLAVNKNAVPPVIRSR